MRKYLYSLCGNFQWPVFAAILLWASFRYKAPTKHKIVLWVIFYLARYWGTQMVPILHNFTNGIFPRGNMGIAFGFFVLMIAAVSFFLRVPVRFSLDVTIPAYIFGRGLAISGCVFYGCCFGFSTPWGIYSAVAEDYTFPTVLLDITASCCIAGYLMWLSKKQKYSGNGNVAAIGMIVFGILRILVDMMRDNRKLVLLFTVEGLFGIAYVLGGCLLLRYIFIRGEHNEK